MQLQRSWRLWTAWLAVALSVALLRPNLARAQDSAAEALFEQGRSLVAAGRVSEACPKFEESQRLDPGVGTQFNLADCYEKVGRIASAWGQFKAAEALAKAQGQSERAAVARARAEALVPRLSRLEILVTAEAQFSGLKVTRDGVEIGKAQWGVAIPVDAGEHRVTAAAPGKLPFDRIIQVGVSAKEALSIPPLEDAPKEALARPLEGQGGDTSDSGAGRGGARLGLTLGLAGVSVAGLAVGSAFGLSALAKNRRSEDYCSGNECLAEGAKVRNDARFAGNVATVGFVAAGVLGGAAAILYFTSERSSGPSLVTEVSLTSAALQFNGSF